MNWDSTEIDLLKVLRPTCSIEEIYQIFSKCGLERSQDAIRRKATKLHLSFKGFGFPVVSNYEDTIQEIIQSIISQRHQTSYEETFIPIQDTPTAKTQKTVAAKGWIANTLQDLLDAQKELPIDVSQPASPKTHKPSLVLLLSDFHMGKKIVGLEQEVVFDSNICEKYIRKIPEKVNKHVSGMGPFDELVVLLLGDMVDGETIYRGQAGNIDAHVAKQVETVVRSIWHILLEFSEMFPLVRVVTVRGNHGRTEGTVESNFDNIVYQTLSILAYHNKDERLSINNRYAEFNTVEVKGWKGIIRHEVPAQVSTASGKSKIAGWKDIHKCHFFAGGHFHNYGLFPYNNAPVFRNGSLCGGDDYSESWGSQDEPAQLLLGITPTHLPLFVAPLFLGD